MPHPIPAARTERGPWSAPRKAARAPFIAENGDMKKLNDEAIAVPPGSELVGTFRWRGQADEIRIFKDAGRLLVEFRLHSAGAAQSAGAVQSGAAQSPGRSQPARRAPMSPAHMGVNSSADIGAHNYAQLAALYRIGEVSGPPVTTSKSATLAYGEQKLLPLPAGYYVSNASVSFLTVTDGDLAPGVLVGRETLRLGDSWTQPRSFGQEYAILATFPAPGDAADAHADPRQRVRVTIECAPSPAALQQWRTQLYESIFRAFQRQALHAAGQDGNGIGRRRGLYSPQQAEQLRLHQACQRLLRRRVFDPSSARPRAADPLFRQFAEETFDWSAMHVEAVGPRQVGPRQDGLTAVRVPVRPEHALALMFFLETGQRWPDRAGDDNDDALLELD